MHGGLVSGLILGAALGEAVFRPMKLLALGRVVPRGAAAPRRRLGRAPLIERTDPESGTSVIPSVIPSEATQLDRSTPAGRRARPDLPGWHRVLPAGRQWSDS
jgi:hypothetical protein